MPMNCHGCKCDHCAKSSELPVRYMTQGEADECCFTCDECRHYDGDYNKRSLWREECENYIEPKKYAEQKEIVAQNHRRRFRVIKGGKTTDA